MLDRIKLGKELGAKAGVTLVELLVVMLIVVILAVSLTPLFRDYVIRARYAAEAIPVVAEMRTKTTLFTYDKGHMPAVPRTTRGIPLVNATYGASAAFLVDGNNSDDEEGLAPTATSLTETPIQTFEAVQTADGNFIYRPAVVTGYDGATGSVNDFTATSAPALVDVAGVDQTRFHFSTDLNVDYEHLTGNRLRPNHVFYRVDHAGYRSGASLYLIGVFGDGANGMESGTGYAVMEIHNPTFERKVVATWQRERPVASDAGQIGIIDTTQQGDLAANIAAATPFELRRENVCWIGNPGVLMSANPGDELAFVEMLESLRDAGWNF